MNSRAWKRCAVPERCGRCGVIVEKDGAILTIALPCLSRKLKRCAHCAEEPMPENLDALPSVDVRPALRPFREVMAERLEMLKRVAPEREEREWYP